MHALFFISVDEPKKRTAPVLSAEISNTSIEIYQVSKGILNAADIAGIDEISQKETPDNKNDNNIRRNNNAIDKQKRAEQKKSVPQEAKSAKKGADALGAETENIIAGYANYVPKPIYPITSRRNKEEGSVIIKINLDEKGKPLKWEIASSSNYKNLDKEAMAVIGRAKFTPASINGKPAQSVINLKITFSLDN